MQENEKEHEALEDDEDEEPVTSKLLAALGILNTLGTLILAVETNQDLLRALEETIKPILIFVFENAVYDLFSEVFEIVDSCTFSTRSISPTMWEFFPVIHKVFKDYAIDYIDGNPTNNPPHRTNLLVCELELTRIEIYPPIENYLSFGAPVIRENQAYKDMLLDFFFTVFETKRLGHQDQISACKLMQSILLHLPGQIDAHLFRVLDTILVKLQDEEEYKKPGYVVFLLEVVIAAVYYNPVATLGYLDHRNFVGTFLEMWFREAEKFLRVYDKRLSILALMKIVQVPSEHVPPPLRQEGALKYLMGGMLKFFEELPDAIKRKYLLTRTRLTIGREEANDLGDDGDSVATEGEEEWNEQDAWSDDEDNGDVADEAQEYLDFLAQQVFSFDCVIDI